MCRMAMRKCCRCHRHWTSTFRKQWWSPVAFCRATPWVGAGNALLLAWACCRERRLRGSGIRPGPSPERSQHQSAFLPGVWLCSGTYNAKVIAILVRQLHMRSWCKCLPLASAVAGFNRGSSAVCGAADDRQGKIRQKLQMICPEPVQKMAYLSHWPGLQAPAVASAAHPTQAAQ